MKNSILLVSALVLLAFSSCEIIGGLNNSTLGGSQSAMGEEGVTISSPTDIAGVTNFEGEIVSNEDGISTYSATATITNSAIKNFFSNIPGVSFEGDQLKVENVQFKNTDKGIEFLTGPTSGILVKYSSSVGDEYPIGDTDYTRKVVSKSTTDDYPYAFYNIKVIEVEEDASALAASGGVSKLTYYANHRFGLVGFKITFDDGSSAKFTVFTSAENE